MSLTKKTKRDRKTLSKRKQKEREGEREIERERKVWGQRRLAKKIMGHLKRVYMAVDKETVFPFVS